MTRHKEASVRIGTTPETLFAHLDDQSRLAAHMSRPSAMMGGGRMTFDLDEARGQAIGSHIRMSGTVFGLKLFVDEVVTERAPPRRKVWRTVAHPKLIVIGHYEMGFEVTPVADGSALRLWVDYDLPTAGPGRIFPLLADWYAGWCVWRIVGDALDTFGAGFAKGTNE